MRISTLESKEKQTEVVDVHLVHISGLSGNAGTTNSRLLRMQVGESDSLRARTCEGVKPNPTQQITRYTGTGSAGHSIAHPLSTPGGMPIGESVPSRPFGKDPSAINSSLLSVLSSARGAKSSSINSGLFVTRRVTGIVELIDSTVTVAGTTICKIEEAAKNKKTTRT